MSKPQSFRSLAPLSRRQFLLGSAATALAVSSGVVLADPVAVEVNGDQLSLRLNGNKSDFSVFTLANPPRLVIDGPTAGMSASAMELQLRRMKALSWVRTTRFNPSHQDKFRIVLELTGTPKYKITQTEGNQQLVSVQAPAGAAVVATAAASAPASQPVEPVKSSSEVRRQQRKVIVIDPGHGGVDPGAIGRNGTKEKHVVLEIAQRVREQLGGRNDLEVVFTRDRDIFIPLFDRRDFARDRNAYMFMSLHADGFTDPSANGASVFTLSERGATSTMAQFLADKENAVDEIAGIKYSKDNDALARTLLDLVHTNTRKESDQLGSIMQQALRKVHRMHSRHVEEAGFAVLKSPDVPSVLVETSFITNLDEERLLTSDAFQNKLAVAISGGIKRFIG
ncbi:N-acetylmuramoyl-L-alanine amidase [Pokkaliibacter sp. MBI-7]|uniref:N-acetylmuramoyl-L-alanine amidase n=1 Tax=Pokkaliibacter sp. MBI-7 TaxID=3040600 RepID=UPI00244CA282|nr:N-acetylmuramoyl-L-alanine amidase [Pokkaliibacter sp. MBI-7]MDH2434110.1 N-acetylmuramoyl-L-alanine amidase [Pokkaliibacter sp. MBI-7]